MAPVEGASMAVGVNGIRIHHDYLYWTNPFAVTVYCVRIIPRGYPIENAQVELAANMSDISSFVNDFNLDAEGNIYVANVYDNTITFINTNSGKAEVIAGDVNSMKISGGTSLTFGRGKSDGDVFYVATSGALANPVGGNQTEEPKVVSANTRPHCSQGR